MSGHIDSLIRQRLPRVVAMAPESIDEWGIRVQGRDRVSQHGYRWPAPGSWAEAPGQVLPGDVCATERTGGIHAARSWRATYSTVRIDRIAVVGWSHGDVVAQDATKVRLARAWVGALLTIPAALRLLRGAYLSGADLREADLGGASLYGVDLSGANLREANLSWADLREADLREADLREAGLSGADLRGADLREADLRFADLGRANLGGADLGGADLRESYLYGANLGGANLRWANLGGAYLRGADLRVADLRGADLREADLGGADLGGAIGVPGWELEAER